MDAVRIITVYAGTSVRQGGKDIKNRSLLVLDPDDIECIWGERNDRTGIRTRSGAEFIVPQNIEQFLYWLSDEVRRWEAREQRETGARSFLDGEHP